MDLTGRGPLRRIELPDTTSIGNLPVWGNRFPHNPDRGASFQPDSFFTFPMAHGSSRIGMDSRRLYRR
jgi:hypothetical protein